jgi:hypothetical protein
MEHDYNWHSKVISEAEYEQAMSELAAAGKAS